MYNKFAKQVVAETLVWIEENLTEPLSIEAIGAQSGYSPWHFQRMFKYFTGVTLGKYIRMRRLTRAMMELKYSTKKIG
ncbi:AraC family transcriptional regulator [Shimwellia pseudoproteus]|uniref:AraC family transcriptional regulator n=1 Tax=Shimwellia pseudoproteus TaxID=570012 RepID=UPI0018ED0172|nr:AraC family transcriptional regulator [Shimwellia pseudoproteus]MBJ3816869.1 AraC family transcriptional regulator [Shimwellia pseudoproteus]